MRIARFQEVPVGGRFEFRGRRYEKLASTFAGSEDRCGHHFHADTEVASEVPLPIRRPQVQLTPTRQASSFQPAASRNKPARIWIDHPGQKLDALTVCG